MTAPPLSQPSNFRKITHLPFRNRSPWIPPRALAPSCGTAKQAPLWNSQPSPTLPLLWFCHPAPTLSCNQGPWSTPPSTRPAPVGTAPPTGHPSKNAIFLLFFLYALETTKFGTPSSPYALGLRPRPPGQLRWVPQPTCHRASFKKRQYMLETTKIRHTLRNLLRP